MRKMRVRRWLIIQKSKNIYLNNEKVETLGQENVNKLVKLASRCRKTLSVNARPKVAVHDEAGLFFSKKGVSYKRESTIVTQTF